MSATLVTDQTRQEDFYRLRISWQYEAIEYLGLPSLKENQPLRLDQIYVPLRLSSDPGREEPSTPVSQILKDRKHIVVLGDPGCGKSTLVKALAYSFGSHVPTPMARSLGRHVPVPIILRDYAVASWRGPEDMLRDFVAHLDNELRTTISAEWLLDVLREGRGILLVDGLDEVGSTEDRRRLRDEVILPLLSQIPESLAVLTSRLIGYEEVPFHAEVLEDIIPELDAKSPAFQIERYYVAAFKLEDIDQYIERWYMAREADERSRSDGITSLQQAVRGNERIKELASNPGLLTLMALIHRVTATLPSGRIKLYDKIVEAYLETIQLYRKLPQFQATLDQMKRWLGVVGYEMQCRRDRSEQSLLASREALLSWLKDAMGTQSEAADAFLDYIARRSGLLLPRGPDQFAFSHLSFQEYFAAWHLRGKIRRFDELVEECRRRVPDRYWHETLVLLFGLLEEFPGSGDDLALNILKRTKAWDDAGRFFASLLEEEDSGIQESLEAAVAAALESGGGGFVGQLRYQPIVRSWLRRRMKESAPGELGDEFLRLVARAWGDDEASRLLVEYAHTWADADWPSERLLYFGSFFSESPRLEHVLQEAEHCRAVGRIACYASALVLGCYFGLRIVRARLHPRVGVTLDAGSRGLGRIIDPSVSAGFTDLVFRLNRDLVLSRLIYLGLEEAKPLELIAKLALGSGTFHDWQTQRSLTPHVSLVGLNIDGYREENVDDPVRREWFQPEHPAYPYLCSPPDEFLRLPPLPYAKP